MSETSSGRGFGSRLNQQRQKAPPEHREGILSDTFKFGCSVFGYTALVREGDFVALTGDGEQKLQVGMKVVLLGDSRGYVPSGFSPGDEVTIVGFTEPFKDGESNHIVNVRNQSHEGWVKPSNIQRNIQSSHR